MEAFLLYAMDNTGAPQVKGELVPGQVREMNRSTEDGEPLYTKIGDRQYHHFTVDVPKRAKKLIISLEGADGVDLTLAANPGSLAFLKDAFAKDESDGSSKTIMLKKPQQGKWYISVFCETAPDVEFGENGFVYTGHTDVLNGVPYKIKVELKANIR